LIPSVEAILRPYDGRLRSELERHGGTLERFIGDAVVAVFGAPQAHEDDAERAVRAALAIRDWAIEEEDVHARVAVNTGEALVSLDARPRWVRESSRATWPGGPAPYASATPTCPTCGQENIRNGLEAR
jgi:class 3 adenylate cyclase